MKNLSLELIENIAAINSMLVYRENIVTFDDDLSIYTVRGGNGSWAIGAFAHGIGHPTLVRRLTGLGRASSKPRIVAVSESDACYPHSGNLLPYPDIIRIGLSNFSAIIIYDEKLSNVSIIKKGPDPEPWIVDWNDPCGNPVKRAIHDGTILGVNPEKEYSEYVKRIKYRPVTQAHRFAFVRNAIKACPFFLERKMW